MTRANKIAQLSNERGFSLVEMLISAGISIMGLAVAAQVADVVQRGYTQQLDTAIYEEEARYAIDWIGRSLRSAGSNPYDITVSACPVANTVFQSVRIDPNLNGIYDDIRINSDGGRPNGWLGGDAGACVEPDEDVTITFDPVSRTISRQDNNIDGVPVVMTEAVITGLQFTYLDVTRVATVDPATIAFVGVTVTAESSLRDPQQTGLFDTVTLNTEVRLRSQ